MTDVSDAEIEALEAAMCRAGSDWLCKCEPGKCGSYSVIASRLDWTATAKALNAPLPALAALARGDAVVVPRVLTEGMGRAMERAVLDHRDGSGPLVGPAYAAALAASPYAVAERRAAALSDLAEMDADHLMDAPPIKGGT